MPNFMGAEHADDIEKLRSLVREAEEICFFTGAGISTESGIADFRSPGGIWSQIKPIQYQRFVEDEDARMEDWRRRFYFKAQYESVEPNEGHDAIARLIAANSASSIVTQNIDGLHQRSGVPDGKVIELYGSGLKASCLDCFAPMTLAAARHCVERDGVSPQCGRCGGIVKADVISFGQPMPQQKLRAAMEAVRRCDLLIVLGSSLVVQPAASIPEIAAQNGADIAIINREATHLDGLSAVTIQASIGEVMRSVAL